MITDKINDLVYQEWPPFADAIGLDYEVSIMVQADPQRPGVFGLFALFVFAADSPILGQRLWHVATPLDLEAALTVRAVAQLLADTTKQFVDIRSEILAQGNGVQP